MNSFEKSLLNVIAYGPSTPSFLLNILSRNVPSAKDKKIKIGEMCYGVTAVKDNVFISGKDKVFILNTDGSPVREVKADGGYNYSLMYNERNDQLLLTQR
jgi:hypothetical protein